MWLKNKAARHWFTRFYLGAVTGCAYVSTDQVLHFLDPDYDVSYFLLCFFLSSVLIVIFYINYLLLISRFLLAAKYIAYVFSLLATIAVVFLLFTSIFLLAGFDPEALARKNPVSEKIIPVIIVNAFLLWMLCPESSCNKLTQKMVLAKSTAMKENLKRAQNDYSLAFKLQVVDDVEKGRLTYKQAQIQYGIQGRSTVLVWLRKHGTLDWTSKTPMKKKAPPKTYISQLEAKIRRLEEEKEILNRAIDVADELFSTEILKKCLPLSLSLIKKEGQVEKPEA